MLVDLFLSSWHSTSGKGKAAGLLHRLVLSYNPATMEQRKHPRFPVNYAGVFSSTNFQGEEGLVQDLSLGGCRMGSAVSMPVNTVLHLQIRPRQAPPIYVPRATVRWVGVATFGVQFHELADHEAKALARLLWSLPNEGGASLRH